MQSLRSARVPCLGALVLVVVSCVAGRTAHADGNKGGTLVISATTLGAEVFVDGERVGTTPLPGPLPLSVDEHTLKVTKPGFAPLIDVIKIARRKATRVEVDLTPVTAILRVKASITDARVFVDGKFVGQAPLESELSVGARAIQVSRGGYKDFFRNVEAVAGQEVVLDVKLDELPAELNPYRAKAVPPPKWFEKWWVWTATAAGVAVVVTAVVVPVVITRRDPVADFAGSYNLNAMFR